MVHHDHPVFFVSSFIIQKKVNLGGLLCVCRESSLGLLARCGASSASSTSTGSKSSTPTVWSNYSSTTPANFFSTTSTSEPDPLCPHDVAHLWCLLLLYCFTIVMELARIVTRGEWDPLTSATEALPSTCSPQSIVPVAVHRRGSHLPLAAVFGVCTL